MKFLESHKDKIETIVITHPDRHDIISGQGKIEGELCYHSNDTMTQPQLYQILRLLLIRNNIKG